MSEQNPQFEDQVDSQQDVRLDEPPMYRVLLLNDDYTTMDFVVEVLKYVFHKSEADANRIMFNVHQKGAGVCGLYPLEIAETINNTGKAGPCQKGRAFILAGSTPV